MVSCGTSEHDNMWLNTDVCGLICACTTYSLLLFAEYVIVFIVLDPFMDGTRGIRGDYHAIAFSIIVFLGMSSHFKAMTTNPGAVPSDARPVDHDESTEKGANSNNKKYRMCLKCDAFKPGRTHHCSVCGRCVVKMDHHCPWVNNCVGLGNHKFFLLFLLYVFTSSIYAMFLIFYRFMVCAPKSHRLRGHEKTEINATVSCPYTVGGGALMFGVVVEAILFGLFTMCMMCDQWSVVLSSMTQIDRLKGERVRKRSTCDNLTEVFGGEPRFSIGWLLPIPVYFKDHERTYGFRRLSDGRVNFDGIGATSEVQLTSIGGTSPEVQHNNSPLSSPINISVEDGGYEGATGTITTSQQGKKYNLVPH